MPRQEEPDRKNDEPDREPMDEDLDEDVIDEEEDLDEEALEDELERGRVDRGEIEHAGKGRKRADDEADEVGWRRDDGPDDVDPSRR